MSATVKSTIVTTPTWVRGAKPTDKVKLHVKALIKRRNTEFIPVFYFVKKKIYCFFISFYFIVY